MRKFLVLLCCGFLLNSCSDGDIQVKNFDFGNVDAKSCGSSTSDFFIYEFSGNEALILQIPENRFVNKETPEGTPISITIDNTVKVIYRIYDGPVTNATLCSSIPPSSPTVTEEWNAEGGTIQITTRAVHSVVTSTGEDIINNFSHSIVFKNITFNRGNDEYQTTDQIVFGTYTTRNLNAPVNFVTIENIQKCADNNLLYKLSGNQSLELNLDNDTLATLFANEATTAGAPRQLYISAPEQLSFKVYGNIITTENLCSGDTGAISEVWSAENGVENSSGLIEVETTTNGSNFIHTVRFKNVRFKNTDGLVFSFGNDYDFGQYITTN
ncbi:MAG: hypothetical protein CFE23_11440 [Flavobacterium sp. BFFFF1]|uniref:hypothetical protein n=1 Tax=Flavobacterium sp. BFFFF1 TaxID=2015557 RepID=UPI000BDB0AE0|nr:hypothetical protein [Flavobacterium sp. BFFFF1]OYU79993.1 MAG: hypothetical protein CFE23_11440 [Flavobacterium sp. BFFFF1]